MGKLTLKCTASTGSRLMGMAYASALDSEQNLDNLPYKGYTKYTHVLLVQSNIYPTSVSNVTWSLVATRQFNVTRNDVESPRECHVDTNTGVFTMMSNYSGSEPTSTEPSQNNQVLLRAPGGIQYDPSKDAWSDFLLSNDYRWGDVTNTFALFTWPNTSVVYQASIAQSNDGAIDIGMLKKNDDGSSIFVNAGRWALNPNTYGYPRKLSFGNNALYMFGSIVADVRTGAFKSTLTKIPLTSSNGTAFSPPTDLPVYDIGDFKNCLSKVAAKFYRSALYVLCEPANDVPRDTFFSTIVFMVTDNNAGRISINSSANSTATMSNLFQPISGGENSDVWGYNAVIPGGISLNQDNFGMYESSQYQVNITEPFGDIDNITSSNPSNVWLYVVIGAVLLLLLIVAIFVWRNWSKLSTQIWPRWKRKIKVNIIEFVSKIDDDNSDNTKNNKPQGGDTRADGSEDSEINKIEEIPMQLIDMDEGHKILVTPDMDLSNLDSAATTVVLSVDAEYMQSANLEHHPRPTVTTSLTLGLDTSGSDLNEGIAESEVSLPNSDRTLHQLPPNRIGRSAPQLYTPSDTTLPLPLSSSIENLAHQEQQVVPNESKTSDILDKDAEGYVQTHSHVRGLPVPRTPSFPDQALPSAPPMEAEVCGMKMGSSLTENDHERGGSSR